MLTNQTIENVVRAALLEDAPWGDLTSQLLIPESAVAGARLSAREAGTFSGGAVFTAAMKLTDPAIEVDLLVSDGAAFEAGGPQPTRTRPTRARRRRSSWPTGG